MAIQGQRGETHFPTTITIGAYLLILDRSLDPTFWLSDFDCSCTPPTPLPITQIPLPLSPVLLLLLSSSFNTQPLVSTFCKALN